MTRWKTDWSKQPFQRKYEAQCHQDKLDQLEIDDAINNQPERLNPEDDYVRPIPQKSYTMKCKIRRTGEKEQIVCDSLNSAETQRERSEEVAPPGDRS